MGVVSYHVERTVGRGNANQYRQYSTDTQYRKNNQYNGVSQYRSDDKYTYYMPVQRSDDIQQNILEISEDDPFTVLPADLKNFEKLGADLYFNLLVKVMLYSLLISLSLPAIVPAGRIILALYNLVSLWLA